MQLNKVSLTWYKFWCNSAAQFAAAECVQHVPALCLFAQISPAILAKHSHTSTNLLVITCSYLQTCIWCFWERIYTKDGNLCRQPSAVSAEVGKSVNIRQTQIGLRILWTCAVCVSDSVSQRFEDSKRECWPKERRGCKECFRVCPGGSVGQLTFSGITRNMVCSVRVPLKYMPALQSRHFCFAAHKQSEGNKPLQNLLRKHSATTIP